MKHVSVCFVDRRKDFISPNMVYEGAGGTGEKCYVQAAVSVLCAVPVCCPCLLHGAGAELALPLLQPPPGSPRCCPALCYVIREYSVNGSSSEGPVGLAVRCPAFGVMVLRLSLGLAIVEFPRVWRHWSYE